MSPVALSKHERLNVETHLCSCFLWFLIDFNGFRWYNEHCLIQGL